MTDNLDTPIKTFSGPKNRIKQKDAPVLELEGLSVTFQKPAAFPTWLGGAKPQAIEAVKNVSLNVFKGETVALIGESGSGKTTIARSILGLVTPQSGKIKFCGNELTGADLTNIHDARAQMSMMFQDPTGSLSPRMKIGDQVIEPLIVHGDDKTGLREKSATLLKQVGLGPEFSERYPHELSGGQARRVGVARALALEPKLLIADEPTAGLDVSIQGDVLNLLNEIQERAGVSMLIITHNMSVVRHSADRMIVLLRGQVVEAGKSADIFDNPSHKYTRDLIAASQHKLPEHS